MTINSVISHFVYRTVADMVFSMENSELRVYMMVAVTSIVTTSFFLVLAIFHEQEDGFVTSETLYSTVSYQSFKDPFSFCSLLSLCLVLMMAFIHNVYVNTGILLRVYRSCNQQSSLNKAYYTRRFRGGLKKMVAAILCQIVICFPVPILLLSWLWGWGLPQEAGLALLIVTVLGSNIRNVTTYVIMPLVTKKNWLILSWATS